MNSLTLIAVLFWNFCGTVKDAVTQTPVSNAMIVINDSLTVTSDANGNFCITLSDFSPDVTVVKIEAVGYDKGSYAIPSGGDSVKVFLLQPKVYSQELVFVKGVRPDIRIPLTETTLSQNEIERNYTGQEVPVILSQTPSVTWYSDGGNYTGYSYMRLRGIDQTRINFTLNGVPLNEPEDQGAYFSNYPDFMNSVRSVQIQRGVGTTSNGTTSFAGSVNFESPLLKDTTYTEMAVSYGSYNTYRVSPEVNSGLIKNKFAVYGRYSYTASDGFREHSGTEGQSLFLSGAYFAKKSVLKFTGFSGLSRNEMSYLAESSSMLSANYQQNSMHREETDKFSQSLGMLQYAIPVGERGNFSASAYYNHLEGGYNIYFAPDLYRYSVESDFAGLLMNYRYKISGWDLTLGAHGNLYNRRHYSILHPDEENHLYNNTGSKNELSSFVKLSYHKKQFVFYGDVQYRHVQFIYKPEPSYELSFNPLQWNFVNPKVGVTYVISSHRQLYATFGQTSREPARNDMFAGFDDIDPYNYSLISNFTRVKPERVRDLELGIKSRYKWWQLNFNIYSMWFHNEIAAIGQLSYIGLPLRKNVTSSYRRGAELSVTTYPMRKLYLVTHANVSDNRIQEYMTDYDSIVYKNVRPLLTPSVILNQSVRYDVFRWLQAEINGRYTSRSFLDNTNNRSYVVPESFVLNGSLTLIWKNNYMLTLMVNNITNVKYYTSGYVQGGESYYFPMATRNYFATLRIRL